MELGDESSKERFKAENGMNKMGGSKQIACALHRSKSRLQSSLSPALTSQQAQLQSVEARPPD
jgi:hypothetical protein